ncbi:MAG: SMI1/KNR4 family protein, partial [Anaerolineaceae bacterium]
IEDWLNGSLPESFKWFLRQYSLLMMPNYIIFGVGNNDEPACLKLTVGIRESGLPAPYVVVENDNDGRIICLDTSRMKDGECPVIGWEVKGGAVKDLYPDFYALLEAKLTDTQLSMQSRKLL